MRKTQWKRVLVGALAVSMIAGNCAPAFAASTGWKQNNTGWWYQNSNGTYKTNTWFQDGNDWYYFDGNGYMVTGWAQDNTMQWFYTNPISNGKKGAMQTGWIQDNNQWYYLNPISDGIKGALQTGWINDGGKWYFADSNGVMQTGVISVDGTIYYLNPTTENGPVGSMLTGTYTIDNKTYTFGSNGASIGIAPATTKKFAANGTTAYTYANSNSSSSGSSSSSSSSRKNIYDKNNNILYIRRAGNINQNALKALGVKDNTVQTLVITDDIKDGTVTIEGLTVTGNVDVFGGGSNTINFNNCSVKGILKAAKDFGQQVRILLGSGTTVNKIESEATAKIELGANNVVVKEVVAKSATIIINSQGISAIIPIITVDTNQKVEINTPTKTLNIVQPSQEVVISSSVEKVSIQAAAKVTFGKTAVVERVEVTETAKGANIVKSEESTVGVIVTDADITVAGNVDIVTTNPDIVVTPGEGEEKPNVKPANAYKISVEPVENAIYTLDKDTFVEGVDKEAKLTIIPDNGYEVVDVEVANATRGDLVSDEGTVTTTITEPTGNVSIKIILKEKETDVPAAEYKITVNAENAEVKFAEGFDADKDKVKEGTEVNFTVTANENYKVTDVKVAGADVTATETGYTFTMPAQDVAIEVTTEAVTQEPEAAEYKITVNAENAEVKFAEGFDADKDKVKEGTEVNFTVTANENYKVTDVKVTGADVTATETGYTFTMPAQDVAIEVTTEAVTQEPEAEFSVTITAQIGTVSGSAFEAITGSAFESAVSGSALEGIITTDENVEKNITIEAGRIVITFTSKNAINLNVNSFTGMDQSTYTVYEVTGAGEPINGTYVITEAANIAIKYIKQ